MRIKIKTFEDACKATNTEFKKRRGEPKDEEAYRKLKIIARALNGKWVPDWDDDNQRKYYPWFYMNDGFSFIGVDDGYYYSGVGSRLCFKSRELAEYAATTFLDIFKAFMTIEK